MNYKLSKGIVPQGQVTLPWSKSMSNRALIIQALADEKIEIENLAACDDTDVLSHALYSDLKEVNVGLSGTAMRFLTAYYACSPGLHIVTGNARMQQRPIGPLVKALREMGAEIEYLQQEGYPPLKINGKLLHGGELGIDASISSQYITALMLIAPKCKTPLTIHLDGKICSRPYIKLTAELMRQCGITVQLNGNDIAIGAEKYKKSHLKIEADWSAASYWYAYLAMQQKGRLTLAGLTLQSLQGDQICARLFETLGIASKESAAGVELSMNKINSPNEIQLDASEYPDLVQTLAVVYCYRNVPFQLSGIGNLTIKESNRLEALCHELKKCGYMVTCMSNNSLNWNGRKVPAQSTISIDTYGDHRMAMAFAPIVARHSIIIKQIEVVNKSYPEFWENMRHFCQIEIEK